MVTAGRLLQSVTARFYATCGWLSFRMGLRGPARRHYERVLRLVGDDFSAYVHLGRIAYDTGDYAGWRREFEHARRADPTRFSRLRHPFELFEPRLAGTTFDDAGERATWRSLRPFGATPSLGGLGLGGLGLGGQGIGVQGIGGRGIGGQGTGDRLGNRPMGDPNENADPTFDGGIDALPAAFDVPAADPNFGPTSGAAFRRASDDDDCLSNDERRRFRELGPIARDELEACDFDELVRRLSS